MDLCDMNGIGQVLKWNMITRYVQSDDVKHK